MSSICIVVKRAGLDILVLRISFYEFRRFLVYARGEMNMICIRCCEMKAHDDFSVAKNRICASTCNACRMFECPTCKLPKDPSEMSFATDGWQRRICYGCLGVRFNYGPAPDAERILKYECAACNYEATSVYLLHQHNKTKKHAISTGAEIPDDYTKEPFTCAACKFGCKTMASLNQHNKGKRHLIRIANA